jgi:hypothetical protein
MPNGTRLVGPLVLTNNPAGPSPNFGLIAEKLVKFSSIDLPSQKWVPMVLLF